VPHFWTLSANATIYRTGAGRLFFNILRNLVIMLVNPAIDFAGADVSSGQPGSQTSGTPGSGKKELPEQVENAWISLAQVMSEKGSSPQVQGDGCVAAQVINASISRSQMNQSR
jgi:hypothetical protein